MPIQIDTFDVSGIWKCPEGVTSVVVDVWGAGSSGSSVNTTGGGGSGGGGARVQSTLTVSPGTSYTINVGVQGGASQAGGDSYFNDSATAMAKGGGSAQANGRLPGVGGSAAASVGDIKHSGGSGGAGFTGTGAQGRSGGAGAAGGLTADGTAGTNANAGNPGTGGTATDGGGNGGNGVQANVNGNDGQVPGGAGSGGGVNGSPGLGGHGRVTVTYLLPGGSTYRPLRQLRNRAVTRI